MLTGPAIRAEILAGKIVIVPFDEACLGPNSYDLHLADELVVYGDAELGLTVGKIHRMERYKIPETGWLLQPNTLYLARTVEHTETLYPFSPQINGKSGLGRLGLNVHQTAGFGDVGFKGTWTLELTVIHQLRVFAGIRICQIAYTRVEGPKQIYVGRYQGQVQPTEYRP
jgi:dCTP deaminase